MSLLLLTTAARAPRTGGVTVPPPTSADAAPVCPDERRVRSRPFDTGVAAASGPHCNILRNVTLYACSVAANRSVGHSAWLRPKHSPTLDELRSCLSSKEGWGFHVFEQHRLIYVPIAKSGSETLSAKLQATLCPCCAGKGARSPCCAGCSSHVSMVSPTTPCTDADCAARLRRLAEQWRAFTVLALFRDPWMRAASQYSYLHCEKARVPIGAFLARPQGCAEARARGAADLGMRLEHLASLQRDRYYVRGRPVFDVALQLERLGTQLPALFERLGVASAGLLQPASSSAHGGSNGTSAVRLGVVGRPSSHKFGCDGMRPLGLGHFAGEEGYVPYNLSVCPGASQALT